MPELYGGDDRALVNRPVPYPAACRPQAWAAAGAVLLLQAATGLYPDVPGGTVRLAPLAGAEFGAVAVDGLRVANTPVDVTVNRTGEATVHGLPTPLTQIPTLPTPRRPTPSRPTPTP